MEPASGRTLLAGVLVFIALLVANFMLFSDDEQYEESITTWNHELQSAYARGFGNKTFNLIKEEVDCHPHWPNYGLPHLNFYIGYKKACRKRLKSVCDRTQQIHSHLPLVWLSSESNARGVPHIWINCARRHNTYYASQSFERDRKKWLDIPVPTFTYPHPGYPMSRKENMDRCLAAKITATFKGQGNSPERKALVRFAEEPAYVIEINGAYGAKNAVMSDLLHNALFGFVPAGDGWHSYRLAETMAMGVVPVIISDDLALPFEDILNWDEFSIRVPLAETSQIPDIIARARSKACDMSDRVFQVYHKYMANASQIMTGIEYSILQHQKVLLTAATILNVFKN